MREERVSVFELVPLNGSQNRSRIQKLPEAIKIKEIPRLVQIAALNLIVASILFNNTSARFLNCAIMLIKNQ